MSLAKQKNVTKIYAPPILNSFWLACQSTLEGSLDKKKEKKEDNKQTPQKQKYKNKEGQQQQTKEKAAAHLLYLLLTEAHLRRHKGLAPRGGNQIPYFPFPSLFCLQRFS